MKSARTLSTLALLAFAAAASAQTPPAPVIPPTGWTVVSVDSEEPGGAYAAGKAFDANPATFWHTAFSLTQPLPPHTLTLNLGARYTLTGFRVLPRQDGITNGRIGQYELAASLDAVTWTTVQTGVLANVATVQEVTIPATVAQYVRLRALSEVNGLPYTAIAELTLLGTPATRQVTWTQGPPAGVATFSAADATAQVYRLYVSGVGAVLAGVTCADTADATVKACRAPLPATVGPGASIEVTASVDGTDESPRSAPPYVLVGAARTPGNVRVEVR